MHRSLEWAAGLFEGEGYITNCGKYPKVGLTMTDEDVVREFVKIIGVGSYRVRDRSPNKTQYEWQITGSKCKSIIENLLPFLGNRRAYKALNILDSLELV